MIVTMRARLALKGKARVERLIKETKKAKKTTTLRRSLLLVTVEKQAVMVPKGTEVALFCHVQEKESEFWPRTQVTFFVSRTVQVNILKDRRGNYEVKVIDPAAQRPGEHPYRSAIRDHGIQAAGVGNMRY